VRNLNHNNDDILIIETWRASHAYILNTFQSLLRGKTRFKEVVVAQRLKRRSTIFNKLNREPKMQLARMHDIAGCRLIFKDIESLNSFREELHKSKFKHKRKNDKDDYNYIINPKDSGYRGIHDIYEYSVSSRDGKRHNGLMIELQYRTIYQHAWATAVEIAGSITENQPKFNEGDERHKEFFKLCSEIIARRYEKSTSVYEMIPYDEIVDRISKIEKEIHLLRNFKAVNSIDKYFKSSKNLIFIFSEKDKKLDTFSFRTSGQATQQYFQFEKDLDETKDIVLVSADSSDSIKNAFRNYFSDTNEFIRLITDAMK
jgi:putative GTP pyrophosphokinase